MKVLIYLLIILFVSQIYPILNFTLFFLTNNTQFSETISLIVTIGVLASSSVIIADKICKEIFYD